MDRNHEVFKHKHIVLANDFFNPLALIRSLGEEGIEPIIVLYGDDRGLLRKSKYAKNITNVNTTQEGVEYIIEHYSNEEYKPFIYECSDDATLAVEQNYSRLKKQFYCMNGQGGLVKYFQKYEQCLAADKCGIRIPKEELHRVGELPTDLRYPVMTKAPTSATGGNWKGNAFVCKNEAELLDAYKKMDVETILIQEYIIKKNELCIDGISISGGDQVFMPYGCGYTRFAKDSYGGYCIFRPFEDNELINKITDLLRVFKYSGIFCVEFLEGEDGNFYFMEVNLRHSGWGYAFTYGGFNLPFRWAVSTLENKLYLEDFKSKKEFSFMSEYDDLQVMVRTGRLSPFKWYLDFWNVDSRTLAVKTDRLKYYIIVHRMFLSGIKAYFKNR